MKINIIGGGPAGLYSAILLKLQNPDAEIHVFERNGRDSTFGFGIVLSSETLGKLAAADPASAASIRAAFTYWDDLYVDYKGSLQRSTGHGFSGLERLTLLQILSERAEQLGVACHWNSDVSDLEFLRTADLLIIADGVNSAVRGKFVPQFMPNVEMCRNHFVWLGTDKPLPGFTFMFKENEHGVWIVHAYQFKKGHSTFVLETTPETFARSGLTEQDEIATVNYVQNLFKDELEGHKVLTNRSHWRQFPKVHCKHWHFENMVLIGDAAHTAHFSIGSGTKLALEDAISLAQSLKDAWSNVPVALAAYERDRRPRSERIQAAAVISLEWFENIQRHWHLPPLQFNFSLLTRSNQISYENLEKRDPVFVAEVAKSLFSNSADGVEPILARLKLGDIELPNRMVKLNGKFRAPVGLFVFSVTGGRNTVTPWAGDFPMDFYHPEWPEKFGAAVLTASQNVPENSVVGISIASTVSVVDAVAMVRTAQSFGCNLANIRHDQLANPLLSPLILCEILRGETGVFVLSSGVLETRDSANTAIAAGRVDLVPLIL